MSITNDPRQDAFVVTLLRSPLIRFAIFLGVVLFFASVGGYVQRLPIRAQIREQDELIRDIRKLGGNVVFGNSDTRRKHELRSFDSVDLTGTKADGQLLKRIGNSATLGRLILDKSDIEPGDVAQLGHLPSLQYLSLAHTRFGDADVAALPAFRRLKSLSLAGTQITNQGASGLQELSSLTSLDLSFTSVDHDGLAFLSALSNLNSLTLDENCFTSGKLPNLQSLNRLRTLVVHIDSSDLGQSTRELLDGKISAHVMALDKYSNLLWNSTSKWSDTNAGIVQTVAEEMSLSSLQISKLLEAIGDRSLNFRQRSVPRADGLTFPQTGAPNYARTPLEPITSVDELVEILKRFSGRRPLQDRVRVFARETFSAAHLPQLCETMRGLNGENDPYYSAHRFGSILLVRRGASDPECLKTLDQKLKSDDPYIRCATIYAFGQWGDDPLNERWIPSQEVVEFGLPRIMSWTSDELTYVRAAVSDALGYLAFHHPKHAPTVLPALLAIIRQGEPANATYSIAKIADVNIEAARGVLPDLHRLLEQAKEEVPSYYQGARGQGGPVNAYRDTILQALCSIVRHDTAVARQLADEYLGRIRRGETAGESIAMLVSPDSRDVTKTILHELLTLVDIKDREVRRSARAALARVAAAVRDLRTNSVN